MQQGNKQEKGKSTDQESPPPIMIDPTTTTGEDRDAASSSPSDDVHSSSSPLLLDYCGFQKSDKGGDHNSPSTKDCAHGNCKDCTNHEQQIQEGNSKKGSKNKLSMEAASNEEVGIESPPAKKGRFLSPSSQRRETETTLAEISPPNPIPNQEEEEEEEEEGLNRSSKKPRTCLSPGEISPFPSSKSATTSNQIVGPPKWETLFFRLFPKKKHARGINDLSLELLNKIGSFLPRAQARRLPSLFKNLHMVGIFAANPRCIDKFLLKSEDPFWLDVDYGRLSRSLTFKSLKEREKESYINLFIKAVFDLHKEILQVMSLKGDYWQLNRYILFSLRFKHLKRLVLCGISLTSIKDYSYIFGAVEELEITDCKLSSSFVLKLGEKANLKIFRMKLCQGADGGEVSDIALEVPSLLSFKYHGLVVVFDFLGATNLLDADIRLEGKTFKHPWKSQNPVHDLLKSLCNVHRLTLCAFCMKHARQDSSKLTFPNLKGLFIHVSFPEVNDAQLEELAFIFRSVPFLEELHIIIQGKWRTSVGFWNLNPIEFLHLRNFVIRPFKGRANEMEFLEFILMHSQQLNNADVHVDYNVVCSSMNEEEQVKLRRALEAALELKRRILALPKVSRNAVISVPNVMMGE